MSDVYLFYVSNNKLWRYFPNSVLSLCNPLRDEGFEPVIFDTVFKRFKITDLKGALFVGFSIYTDTNITLALEIASAIRRAYPQLPLVWGGPHAIMVPEQTSKHPLVDFVSYGEGETAIVELAKAIAVGKTSFENVPGIIWKDGKGNRIKNPPAGYVNMDKLQIYPYELLNEDVYNLRHGKMYYEASRGCPYGCKFCSYDHTRWRYRSAQKVIDDLAVIEEKFSPKEIQIIDANHFMDLSWVEEIWQGKIKRNLQFKWETNCRFDTLSKMPERALEALASSGCYQLRLGAESGSQRILDYLNKGITVEQILSGIELCQKHKINALISFMVGYPPEEQKDVDATVELINQIKKRFSRAQINGLFQFQPYTNTRIFKEITAQHSIPQPKGLDGWSDYQIIEIHRKDFPWLRDKKYRDYLVMNAIISYLFFSEKLKNMPIQQRKAIAVFKNDAAFALFKLLDFFIKRVFVDLRWRKRIMLFPAEWYIWNFIRKNILKLY
ncbi:MAG: radical SAM protein [Candidatus Omnitrophota bacterium]